MSGPEEKSPGSDRKPAAGRRRRRRRRPGRKTEGQPADAAPAAQPGAQPAPAGRPAGEPGGGRRKRRRTRREGAPPASPETAQPRSGDQPAQPRRSRRRRKRRGPAAERAAAEGQRTSVEAAQADLQPPAASMAFPDEEAWDLHEQDTPVRPVQAQAPEEELEVDDPLWTLPLEADAPPPQGRLCNCVLVRLRDRSSVAAYEGGESSFEQGERVVVETEQGQTVGCVAHRSYRTLADGSMPRLIRRIDHNDMRQEARNAVREREAFALCNERIRHRGLPMKLIRVEYLHGGNKAIFYFAAEHRVDFRDLVKDLAQRLHTRIVMRQVGVRDEAKMTGGIGSCGMPLCCSGWLARFEPVSIRMAKDQNLVLNPQKVSGQCGRLKCCLTYEQLQYHEARRRLPKPGRMVRTPEGEGKVQEVDILRGIVRVSLPDGKIQSFDAAQVEAIAADGKAPAKGQSEK